MKFKSKLYFATLILLAQASVFSFFHQILSPHNFCWIHGTEIENSIDIFTGNKYLETSQLRTNNNLDSDEHCPSGFSRITDQVSNSDSLTQVGVKIEALFTFEGFASFHKIYRLAPSQSPPFEIHS